MSLLRESRLKRCLFPLSIGVFILVFVSPCSPSHEPPLIKPEIHRVELHSANPGCICGDHTVLNDCDVDVTLSTSYDAETASKRKGEKFTAFVHLPADPSTILSTFPLTLTNETQLTGVWKTPSLDSLKEKFGERALRFAVSLSVTFPEGTATYPTPLVLAYPPPVTLPYITCIYWTDKERKPLPLHVLDRPAGEAARFFYPVTQGSVTFRVWERDVFDPTDPIGECGETQIQYSEDRKTAYCNVIPRGGNDPHDSIKDDCRYGFSVDVTTVVSSGDPYPQSETIDGLSTDGDLYFGWSDGCAGEPVPY